MDKIGRQNLCLKKTERSHCIGLRCRILVHSKAERLNTVHFDGFLSKRYKSFMHPCISSPFGHSLCYDGQGGKNAESSKNFCPVGILKLRKNSEEKSCFIVLPSKIKLKPWLNFLLYWSSRESWVGYRDRGVRKL